MTSRQSPGPFAVALALSLLVPATRAGAEAGGPRVPVRVGWQVAAATQGQLVQVLKRTDVLELHGFEPTFVPFSYGTPEVQSALEGKLDVVFAGDQPTVNLVTRGGRFTIVARLSEDRVALLVPPESPVSSVRDLRGKTVGVPFGSVAHRVAVEQEEAAGLDPAREVRNEDLDVLDLTRRVRDGGVERWGALDAVAVWEPAASQLELEGHARVLASSRTLDVVAVSNDFMATAPGAAEQLLVALVRSWHYFAANQDRVRQWYLDDAQLGYTPAPLAAAARLDPNLEASTPADVDLRLSDADLEGLARAAAFARRSGNARGTFRLDQAVDRSPLVLAMERVRADDFEALRVVVPSAREAELADGAGSYLFDRFPLWLVFALIVGVSFLGLEAGQRLGRWRARHEGDAAGPVGTVVGAVLALLAFVIALTFSAAGERFDARKEALLDEVNAIGTAYLRADLLPEPHRTTSRLLLRDYVEVRLGMYRAYGDPEALRTVQARTAALQGSLWSHARALAEQDRSSEVYALFTEALNEVFDLHTKRVVLGAEYRIPSFVWWALAVISVLAMVAVGFQFGIEGKRSLFASLALGVTFALVILLIFDLDRPGEGVIQVNQRPMIELYQGLGQPR